jgi:hypothetical protein
MTKIKSFTVGLPVTELKQAVEWYRQLLGEVERSIQPLEFGNSKSSLRAGCSSLKVKSMDQISQ